MPDFKQPHKKIVGLFGLLALVGFADAIYLTVEHYLGVIPPCAITSGCSAVLTSKWSTVAGIPVALLGALFYLGLLVLTIIYLRTDRPKIILTAAMATTVDLLVSAFLVGIQIFVIKQICFYCMISAITSTALFIVGMIIFFQSRVKSSVQENLQH